MDAQWYYNNATPISGMDAQDVLERDDHDDGGGGIGVEEEEDVGRRRRPRPVATKQITVPHPNNNNLRLIYEIEDDNAPLPPPSAQPMYRQPPPGSRRAGVPRKQGSPKKQKTEPESINTVKQASTVLEIENRVLRDMLSRPPLPHQPDPPSPAPSPSPPPISQQQQQATPSPPSVPVSKIGAGVFHTVPSFNMSPEPPPPSSSSEGAMYDIGKSGKEPMNVFLYDWFTGTPYDKFDFDALKRHLARKATMLADPVMKFVANVAPLCGTSLERLLVQNVVYEDATNMKELVSKSTLNQELLAVLLAVVLNEVLGNNSGPGFGGRGGGGGVVINATTTTGKGKQEEDDDEGELIPFYPVKKQEQKTEDKKILVKPEPDNSGDTSINHSIYDEVFNAKRMLERHSDGHPLPCQAAVSAQHIAGEDVVELIGVDGFRSLVHGPPAPGHNPIFADLMSILDYSLRGPALARWNWNNLPENVGMALIKPEVVAMIETTYEEIRAIGAVQAQFTLHHLMTSPRIRQEFALMVATAINIIPSELQYPGASAMRGNGSITDRRVTSGAMREFRHTLVYKSKKKYFERVAYAESTAWKDANAKIRDGGRTLDSLRKLMWTAITELKLVLGADVRNERVANRRSLAQALGLLQRNTEYYYLVMTAYETVRMLQNTKREGERAVARLTTLDEGDVAYAAKRAVVDADIQQIASQHERHSIHLRALREMMLITARQDVDGDGRQNPWKKHFATRLSIVVIPFLSYPALDTNYNQEVTMVAEHAGVLNTPEIDMVDVESRIAALLDVLKMDMATTSGWQDNYDVRTLLQESLATAASALQAIRRYGSASVQYTNALTDVNLMSDDEKRELVYVPLVSGEIPPVRNFLYPRGMSANMFV